VPTRLLTTGAMPSRAAQLRRSALHDLVIGRGPVWLVKPRDLDANAFVPRNDRVDARLDLRDAHAEARTLGPRLWKTYRSLC